MDAAGNTYALVVLLPQTATFESGQGSTGLVVQNGMETTLSKLDVAGVEIWKQKWTGVNGVMGSQVNVGSGGEVTVVGSFRGTVDFDQGAGERPVSAAGESDGFIVRLDGAGVHAWSPQLGGVGLDEIHALAVDNRGGVYVGGSFYGMVDLDPGTGVKTHVAGGTGEEAFVLKLSGTGGYVWSRVVGGAADDRVQGIAVDRAGDVYVTGYYGGVADFDPGAGEKLQMAAGGTDAYVLKLTTAGKIALDTQAPLVAAVTRQSPQDAAVVNRSVVP